MKLFWTKWHSGISQITSVLRWKFVPQIIHIHIHSATTINILSDTQVARDKTLLASGIHCYPKVFFLAEKPCFIMTLSLQVIIIATK
jgi:hypothetical protein